MNVLIRNNEEFGENSVRAYGRKQSVIELLGTTKNEQTPQSLLILCGVVNSVD